MPLKKPQAELSAPTAAVTEVHPDRSWVVAVRTEGAETIGYLAGHGGRGEVVPQDQARRMVAKNAETLAQMWNDFARRSKSDYLYVAVEMEAAPC